MGWMRLPSCFWLLPQLLLLLLHLSRRATAFAATSSRSHPSLESPPRAAGPTSIIRRRSTAQERDSGVFFLSAVSKSSAEPSESCAPGFSLSASDSSSTSPSTPSSEQPAFYDRIVLQVRAGSGGAGATSYATAASPSSRQRGPPDGGSGGRGGHVVVQVDRHLNTLAGLVRGGGGNELFLRAGHGHPGQRRHKPGAAGKDCVVRVPPGTIVEELVSVAAVADLPNGINSTSDAEQECQWVEVIRLGLLESPETDDLFDELPGSQPPSSTSTPVTFILAHGGRGGDGNGVLARSSVRRSATVHSTIRPREGPTAGERKTIRLTLQFLADVAVIGVPNAGKSTFLAAVTRAKPKIANYPFTTVIPNLGVWQDNEEEKDDDLWEPGARLRRPASLVLCDVPGLIDGASRGVGLGHAFLRHAELCHALVHVVDASSSRDQAVEDYLMVNRELVKYSPALASKPQVVILNKVDALREDEDPDALSSLREQLLSVMPHSRILTISAKEGDGVKEAMRRLFAFVQKVRTTAARTGTQD